MSSRQRPSDKDKDPKLGLGETINVRAREPAPLDIGKMKDQIVACATNIERFNEGIRVERAMIEDLQKKIAEREAEEQAALDSWKTQDPDTKEWHNIERG